MRFAYLLARTFPGGDEPWNVDVLLERMGHWFDRWWEVYQVDPWGPKRDDWRARTHASVMGSPGNASWITYPNSFEAIELLRKLKAIESGDEEGEEQQSEEAAFGLLKALGEMIKKSGG